MRRLITVLTIAALGVPMYAASAGPIAAASPSASARHWINHDHDAWGGAAGAGGPSAVTNPQGCDPIDPAQCMLPYPNDWFTRSDSTSATGRRLNLNALAMPRNIAGLPIDPTPWNDSDGFSAGSQILTVVPGMTRNRDLAASRLPTDVNLAVNEKRNLGVVLIDATTGKQWPVWAEIDQYTDEAGVLPAGATSPVQQDLMIHPARNLLDGHRYIVGLRHLVTDKGTFARQSSAFSAYVRDFRHHVTGSDPRAAHMNGVLANLKEAGWKISSNPKDLFLAWDFTTASSQNVTGRLLAIRDDAFSQLGETKAQIDAGKVAGRAPSFTVSKTINYTAKQNPNVAREIDGSFTVPCYIFPTCSLPVKCDQITAESPFDDCPTPGTFYFTDPTDPDAVPSQVPGQTYQSDFICVVGRKGFHAGKLFRPVEYGHGLFGSNSEVRSSPQEEMANREGTMYCATPWFGFANADVPNALLALTNLSLFPLLTDRAQQGELNFLYLQRLMISPHGFATNPAFQRGGKTFINLHDGVYYDGNSQGGIYGGTVCAVSIDARRCALGVPGMDYPLLLPRSVDYVATKPLAPVVVAELQKLAADPASYDPTDIVGDVGYSNVLDTAYPDQAQRQLLLDILSTLWDRSDPDGFAGHMTASAVGGLLRDCTGKGVVPVAKVNKTCPLATPDHHVLLQVAWGDHQVANMTAFDEARTIGARAVGTPPRSNRIGSGDALIARRLCSHEPKGNLNDPVDGNYCWSPSSVFWDLKPIRHYPYDGSAIVLFDGGPDGSGTPFSTDPPPPSDVPPPDTDTNQDPHEGPRRACAAQDQKGAFFHRHHGYVRLPKQQFTNGHRPAGPPYFDGGWKGSCALP